MQIEIYGETYNVGDLLENRRTGRIFKIVDRGNERYELEAISVTTGCERECFSLFGNIPKFYRKYSFAL